MLSIGPLIQPQVFLNFIQYSEVQKSNEHTFCFSFNKTKFLSKIDLTDAFCQIPLSEDSENKTSLTASGFGLMRFNRLCFGLRSASESLVRLLDIVLRVDLEPFVFVYLDDLVISTDSFCYKDMELG